MYFLERKAQPLFFSKLVSVLFAARMQAGDALIDVSGMYDVMIDARVIFIRIETFWIVVDASE